MLESTLLRIGAVSVILGVVIFSVAGIFHGGHEPHNLVVTLPQYSGNPKWLAVHLGQFIGQFLVVIGLVALYRSLTVGPSAALAFLGFVTTLVSFSTYAAVQGVDGFGIKFVADKWVNASDAEKGVAFRVAEAVRHIEVGLTTLSVFLAGIAFMFFGLAIAMSDEYPRWLGWVTGVLGILWSVVGLGFAYSGFAPWAINLSLASGGGLFVWALIMGALMWCRAGERSSG
jgi:hypothetical protein